MRLNVWSNGNKYADNVMTHLRLYLKKIFYSRFRPLECRDIYDDCGLKICYVGAKGQLLKC